MTLVIGYGNPGRGDDGLGPECARRLGEQAPWPDTLVDYQLKVEHVLDVAAATRVVFVDASVDCAPPFRMEALAPTPQGRVDSHALSPGTLLALAHLTCGTAPEAYLMAIRGVDFGRMHEGLSPEAEAHLRAAERHLRDWLAAPAPGPTGA